MNTKGDNLDTILKMKDFVLHLTDAFIEHWPTRQILR